MDWLVGMVFDRKITDSGPAEVSFSAESSLPACACVARMVPYLILFVKYLSNFLTKKTSIKQFQKQVRFNSYFMSFPLLFPLQPNIIVCFFEKKSIQRDNLNFHGVLFEWTSIKHVKQKVESKNAREKCEVCCFGPRGNWMPSLLQCS